MLIINELDASDFLKDVLTTCFRFCFNVILNENEGTS